MTVSVCAATVSFAVTVTVHTRHGAHRDGAPRPMRAAGGRYFPGWGSGLPVGTLLRMLPMWDAPSRALYIVYNTIYIVYILHYILYIYCI